MLDQGPCPSLHQGNNCPAEEGSESLALVGTWHPARVNPPQRGYLELLQSSKVVSTEKHILLLNSVVLITLHSGGLSPWPQMDYLFEKLS